MDYAKLIEDMREIACKNSVSLYKRGRCADAATAIEALHADLRRLQTERDTLLAANQHLMAEREQLTAERDAAQAFLAERSGVTGSTPITTAFGVPLDRLRELVEADREGRCFISDVKLGGEVFYIPQFNGKPYCGIQKGHVQAVSFTKAGKRIKIREYHAHNQDFMLGKTVFLTYEATEAALKAREQE